MRHFYSKIQGWFGAKELYRAVVDIFGNGAHFVEIGAWKGQSAAFMAVEIINSNKDITFDVIDTWQGSEEHVNPKSPSFEPVLAEKGTIYPVFEENLKPVIASINPIISTSVDASKRYEDNSLDFVFVDGAHDYKSVSEDIKCWLPKVKENGIIAGDDYDWPGVKQSVNENFMDDLWIHDNNIWIHSKDPGFSYEDFAAKYYRKPSLLKRLYMKLTGRY